MLNVDVMRTVIKSDVSHQGGWPMSVVPTFNLKPASIVSQLHRARVSTETVKTS